MRFGLCTKETLFSAVKRFLSFSKDLCVLCHKNEARYQIKGGKCCHVCHVKMCKRKIGKNEQRRNFINRHIVNVTVNNNNN